MSSARIEAGSIVEFGAVICSNTKVSISNIIMRNAVIDHEAIVEDFYQLKYCCVISEHANIPNMTRIDYNAVIN